MSGLLGTTDMVAIQLAALICEFAGRHNDIARIVRVHLQLRQGRAQVGEEIEGTHNQPFHHKGIERRSHVPSMQSECDTSQVGPKERGDMVCVSGVVYVPSEVGEIRQKPAAAAI